MAKKLSPPRWCKNAVPTVGGWADPKTGELYVCNRHLENPIPGWVKGRRWDAEAIVRKLAEEAKAEDEPQPEPEAKPKRKRGRPRKNALKELTPEQVAEAESKPKRKRGRPRKNSLPE